MTTTAKNMTLRDFHHPFMHWGSLDQACYWEAHFNARDTIPKDATPEEAQAIMDTNKESLHQEYLEQELILDVPEDLTDGVYSFSLNRALGHITMGYGLVIQDGKIDPNLTAHAVFITLARHLGDRPNLQQTYINQVQWDGGRFQILVDTTELIPLPALNEPAPI